MQFSANLDIDTILHSPNVAEHLTDQEGKELARFVIDCFDTDRQSRMEWETRMEKASKIALQVAEQKSFPWPGASNVKFPLMTIASLQYHSRAYPALVDSPNIVKCATYGTDEKDEKYQSAQRVSEHMSWQLIEEDSSWEEDMDKALLVQPIMGCAFKKTYFDPNLGHNVSELVLPQDFVINYYSKSIEKSPRYTHILQWSGNDLEERMRRGLILDTSTKPPSTMPLPFGQLASLKDKSQGLTAPANDPDQPFTILEQHCWIDLDGDGYKEPYVVLVRYDTRELLRVSPRFLSSGIIYNLDARNEEDRKRIVRIQPEQYFTKIPFIPSPDGGFYDLGFGHLLGPLNESIDTALNQLFDAGTMHNAGGGFLGRGAKFKSGAISLRPNEWVRVDASGDDLRKSVIPAPIREPSAVLFQLIGLLIDYGQRIAGAPDIIQGQNPGQNTPAETSRNMMEQGIKVFSGIYKRTYRAMKEEFRLLYRLNQLFLEESQEFLAPRSGLPMKILAQDYQLPKSFISPAADPHYMSDAQRQNQANALMQAAHSNPGYNLYEVNRFWMEANRVPMMDKFLPDPKGPNAIPTPPNPKLQIEQLKAQTKEADMQLRLRLKLFELMEAHDLHQAQILKLEAEAAKALEEAGGVRTGQAIAAFDAQLGAMKAQHEGRLSGIKALTSLIEASKQPEQKAAE